MNSKPKHHLPRLAAALLTLGIAASAMALPVYAETADSDQTTANVEFTGGKLELMSAPVLSFGTQPITAGPGSYAAEGDIAPVQVSDLRGTGKGWSVKVGLSPFSLKGDEANNQTLKGASIIVNDPAVAAVNDTVGSLPSATAVELTSDNAQVKVFTADPNATENPADGMGVWNLQWAKDSTKLQVKPGTAAEGENVAQLNWLLEDAP